VRRNKHRNTKATSQTPLAEKNLINLPHVRITHHKHRSLDLFLRSSKQPTNATCQRMSSVMPSISYSSRRWSFRSEPMISLCTCAVCPYACMHVTLLEQCSIACTCWTLCDEHSGGMFGQLMHDSQQRIMLRHERFGIRLAHSAFHCTSTCATANHCSYISPGSPTVVVIIVLHHTSYNHPICMQERMQHFIVLSFVIMQRAVCGTVCRVAWIKN
jgi:hypothetical protein